MKAEIYSETKAISITTVTKTLFKKYLVIYEKYKSVTRKLVLKLKRFNLILTDAYMKDSSMFKHFRLNQWFKYCTTIPWIYQNLILLK